MPSAIVYSLHKGGVLSALRPGKGDMGSETAALERNCHLDSSLGAQRSSVKERLGPTRSLGEKSVWAVRYLLLGSNTLI